MYKVIVGVDNFQFEKYISPNCESLHAYRDAQLQSGGGEKIIWGGFSAFIEASMQLICCMQLTQDHREESLSDALSVEEVLSNSCVENVLNKCLAGS